MDKILDPKKYTAVLLAAGHGSRISELTDKPKCLLEINGKTLLERHLDIWKELGIGRVHLVLGYKKELVMEVADKYQESFEIRYFFNDDYVNKGNTFSLLLGIEEVPDSTLIFDADLIYEPSLLEKLVKSSEKDQILIGPGKLDDIECAKALVDDQNNVRMTIDKRKVTEKELEKYHFAGEAVGILKFSENQTQRLTKKTREFLSYDHQIKLNWEHLLNQYLQENDVKALSFQQGKWMEVDTPEDWEYASSLFREGKL